MSGLKNKKGTAKETSDLVERMVSNSMLLLLWSWFMDVGVCKPVYLVIIIIAVHFFQAPILPNALYTTYIIVILEFQLLFDTATLAPGDATI